MNRSSKIILCISLLAFGLIPQLSSARFLSVDPRADQYPSVSPYVYALNNPIIFIDPNGMEAWEITAEWDDDTQKQYQEYASKRAEEYRKNGTNNTCEDLALNILIDFASENSLPISITNGSGTFSASSDDFNNVSDFRNSVLSSTGASDLQRTDNTVSTTLDKLSSGDLILLTNDAGTAYHTQVVTSASQSSYGIHQGNFGFWGNLGLGSSNPSAFNYAGSDVQRGTYTLNPKTDTYSFSRPGRAITPNAFSAFGAQFRVWNFGNWK